jgi:cytochrome d ubiquinol oxidase subunit II
MCYAITTAATLIYMPHMTEAIKNRPEFFVVALLNMFAVANIPREINRGRDAWAFASSCFNIMCLLALFGLGTFPNAVRAINDPENLSLTIWNSASSEKTLGILLIISIIGIPLVIAYTVAIYWIFHGKVKLDSHSY